MTGFKRWGAKAIVATAAAMAAVIAAGAGETSPEAVKQQGKQGKRVVGVSSICQPPRQSIAATEKSIDAAASDKPDLILLTEGCMCNTSPSASRHDKDARSEPLPEFGPISQSLSRKAAQYHSYIMACYWRRAAGKSGRYNSAVLFDRQGKLAGCYNKTFPTIGEMEDGILPGQGAKVFNTDFGRIGAMICYDFNFPELLAEYKKQGVELICFLSNYRAGRLIPAAALRNQCFFASSVPGENGVIVNPLGHTLAESSQYGTIIFARINLDSRVVHIDYNAERVRRMKEKYGPAVRVETASPEAVYFLTSWHPEKSIGEMIAEFEIKTLDAYLDRARDVRRQNLPKADEEQGKRAGL